MQPRVLTTGLSTVLVTPKISATTTSVVTLDSVVPASSWMPGTTAVATNRATAVIATLSSTFMRTSCHAARDASYARDAASGRLAQACCHPGPVTKVTAGE